MNTVINLTVYIPGGYWEDERGNWGVYPPEKMRVTTKDILNILTNEVGVVLPNGAKLALIVTDFDIFGDGIDGYVAIVNATNGIIAVVDDWLSLEIYHTGVPLSGRGNGNTGAFTLKGKAPGDWSFLFPSEGVGGWFGGVFDYSISAGAFDSYGRQTVTASLRCSQLSGWGGDLYWDGWEWSYWEEFLLLGNFNSTGKAIIQD
ncbi:MAG: hypothetical protein NZ739_00180 [Verrucomicrobiae bacterium]|nr:hypothetical protein [Verrucomicrobiae bacterium]